MLIAEIRYWCLPVDVSRFFGSLIIKELRLNAGTNKVGMDPFSEVTDEQKEVAEAIMVCLHTSFIDAVKTRREGKLDLSQAHELFSGMHTKHFIPSKAYWFG